MDRDSKFGVGLIALFLLCCEGLLALSLLATRAILGALSAIWTPTAPESWRVLRCLSHSAPRLAAGE